jgi:F-type H+-transporting ATPase subunit a
MNMITNLFSVFDPSSSFSLLPLNWIRALIFLIALTPIYWPSPNKSSLAIFSIFYKLHQEFKILLGPSSFNGTTTLFIPIFFFIILNNFIGLFPYVFTASSHITLTLTLRLPLWVSFILFGWINYFNYIFAHIVPQSTPNLLMPFIVLIESVRNIIRPLTLAVRLIANIVAGHLLITLLGNQTATASGITLISLILIQILLLTLESAVALIQSYVFTVLATLYSREITSH